MTKKDPLDTAVFFVDRSIGKKLVPPLLRDAGFAVEIHDDHFPPDSRDELWLSFVGARRWFVITRDDRIRYRILESAAVRSARVGMFVVVSKNLTGSLTADIIVKARNNIRRFIKKHRRPFIAKIYRDGKIQRLPFQ